MTADSSRPVPAAIALWHRILETRELGLLDRLLHDDVVFESPVVHTPQRGKAITSLYLRAADEVLNNADWRYLDAWYGPQSAVLEFETRVDGILINGIDMISWDAQDRVTHFKVMVRPLKAIQTLHPAMGAVLMRLAPKP